jgi:hypothetical protein
VPNGIRARIDHQLAEDAVIAAIEAGEAAGA